MPAEIPDLNPIENGRSIMKQRLRMLHKDPTTVDELFELLSDLWKDLPDDYFTNISESMVRRSNAIKDLAVILANIETYVKLDFIV